MKKQFRPLKLPEEIISCDDNALKTLSPENRAEVTIDNMDLVNEDLFIGYHDNNGNFCIKHISQCSDEEIRVALFNTFGNAEGRLNDGIVGEQQ